MGTSMVVKSKNAELVIKLLQIEDNDDFMKEIKKNLQKQTLEPLECNEQVAQRLQGLVRQYAKGTCTSVGQMENLRVLLQLVTMVASFPKDGGLLALLQHGLLFTISEMILAAVQCVKGPRGDEAEELFKEATKTIRVMSDHSQKANEMVCEHYFHRITQLVTSEKFLMLRNEALNTVKYFLMGCPERVRIILETKPKVKAYVDKLGQMLKNTSDMSLQTEIIKVLSLLMVKVNRKNVAKTWFDFDDDLDDFLHILNDASNLDSTVSSFLHKFNCITYCSQMPPPPVFKQPKPVKSKQPAAPVYQEKAPTSTEKDLVSEEKGLASCKKGMTSKENEEANDIQCIPESEPDNLEPEVRAVPETQIPVPQSPEQPSTQQSAGSGHSNHSLSKKKMKASVSTSAVHVVISPKGRDVEEPIENEMDNPDVIAGTPEVCSSIKRMRPTNITTKSSKSSVILINRNQNVSSCLSSEDSDSVENEVVDGQLSQQVIPDSHPLVEHDAPTNLSPQHLETSQCGGSKQKVSKKMSQPVRKIKGDSQQRGVVNETTEPVRGSQDDFSEESLTGRKTKKGWRRPGKKGKVFNSAPVERHTRSSSKDVGQSQIPDSIECEQATDKEGRPRRRSRGNKTVEVTGGKVQANKKKEGQDKSIATSVGVAGGSEKTDKQKEGKQDKEIGNMVGLDAEPQLQNPCVSQEMRMDTKKQKRRTSCYGKVVESGPTEIDTPHSVSDFDVVGGNEKTNKKKEGKRGKEIGDIIEYEANKRQQTPPASPERSMETKKQKRGISCFSKVVESGPRDTGTPCYVDDFEVDGGNQEKNKKEERKQDKHTGYMIEHETNKQLQNPPTFPEEPMEGRKRKKRTSCYSKVVESGPPDTGTPCSVYDFEERETTKPAKSSSKYVNNSSAKKEKSVMSPYGRKCYENKGAKRRSGKKMSPKTGVKKNKNILTRNSDSEKSTCSVDHNEPTNKGKQCKENTKKKNDQNTHQEEKSAKKKTTQNNARSLAEYQDDEIEIEVMDSAPSVTERHTQVATPLSPMDSIASETAFVTSPFEDDENLPVKKASKKCIANETAYVTSPFEDDENVPVKAASKKIMKKRVKHVKPVENNCNASSLSVQQNEHLNEDTTWSDPMLGKQAKKKNRDSASEEEEEETGYKDTLHDKRNKGKQAVWPSTNTAVDLLLSSKNISQIDNINTGDETGYSPPETDMTDKGTMALKESTCNRHRRKAVEKIKSYAETEDNYSLSFGSADMDSVHLSQADYINAQIDTPCPLNAPKLKKKVHIVEKENSVASFSQNSRGRLLWSVKKKPVKGYDKTYSKPKILMDKVNIYDYDQNGDDDDISSQGIPSPTPSPPAKKSVKRGPRKAKVNVANKTKVQKQKSQSNVSDSPWPLEQVDLILEKCRKSLAVKMLSDEETEARPPKKARKDVYEFDTRIDDSNSDDDTMKTPMNSTKKRSADDSIEMPRTPFATPYLVDASPEMPVFNREEFMAEMRNLIQISDTSSRTDPTLSLHESPILSQALASPVAMSTSTRSNSTKGKGSIMKTPASVTRDINIQTPAGLPQDCDFPEIEASPCMENWMTPVTELLKTPTPPRLPSPEIPRFDYEFQNNSTGEEEYDDYSSLNFGRITPGILQSGGYQIPSIDTPIPISPMVLDKEEANLDTSISEEIDKFSYNFCRSTTKMDKSKKASHIKELSQILQDEIKHAEEELLCLEQYIYMFVAFYENLRKRMYRLKEFQLERIQRFEDILLKISGSTIQEESPINDFEVQIKKLGQMFRASLSTPCKITRQY